MKENQKESVVTSKAQQEDKNQLINKDLGQLFSKARSDLNKEGQPDYGSFLTTLKQMGVLIASLNAENVPAVSDPEDSSSVDLDEEKKRLKVFCIAWSTIKYKAQKTDIEPNQVIPRADRFYAKLTEEDRNRVVLGLTYIKQRLSYSLEVEKQLKIEAERAEILDKLAVEAIKAAESRTYQVARVLGYSGNFLMSFLYAAGMTSSIITLVSPFWSGPVLLIIGAILMSVLFVYNWKISSGDLTEKFSRIMTGKHPLEFLFNYTDENGKPKSLSVQRKVFLGVGSTLSIGIAAFAAYSTYNALMSYTTYSLYGFTLFGSSIFPPVVMALAIIIGLLSLISLLSVIKTVVDRDDWSPKGFWNSVQEYFKTRFESERVINLALEDVKKRAQARGKQLSDEQALAKAKRNLKVRKYTTIGLLVFLGLGFLVFLLWSLVSSSQDLANLMTHFTGIMSFAETAAGYLIGFSVLALAQIPGSIQDAIDHVEIFSHKLFYELDKTVIFGSLAVIVLAMIFAGPTLTGFIITGIASATLLGTLAYNAYKHYQLKCEEFKKLEKTTSSSSEAQPSYVSSFIDTCAEIFKLLVNFLESFPIHLFRVLTTSVPRMETEDITQARNYRLILLRGEEYEGESLTDEADQVYDSLVIREGTQKRKKDYEQEEANEGLNEGILNY